MQGSHSVALLSGPLCSGKTTTAIALARALDLRTISARDVLQQRAGLGLDRRGLQAFGRTIEEETRGRWLAEALSMADDEALVVVDAARTVAQVSAFREVVQKLAHIHLLADRETRRRRFAERESDNIDSGVSFEEIEAGEIEVDGDAIRVMADLVVDTSVLNEGEVCAAALRLASPMTA